MNALTTVLDRQLGRFTMYRLVTVVLAVLAVVAIIVAAAGGLDPTIFPVGAMVLTLGVIVAASLAANLVLGRLVGAHPHLESSFVTALILWFLYWPTTDVVQLAWLAGIAALAQASKYLIVWRRRHLVNPAAAGVVLSLLIGHLTDWPIPFTAWWVASGVLFWFVLVGALIVLYRTRRLGVGLAFAVVAYPFTVWGLTAFGTDFGTALTTAAESYPIVWFAGFMLSEPLTLPPRRWQQLFVAVVGALVFTWPLASYAVAGESLTFAPFETTYEVTLVITGLIAFAFRQGSRTLVLRERRTVADDAVEYVFRADRPLAFAPGQYVEVDVPHRGVDTRGRRRMFSVVSTPGQEVVLATRHPEPGSSYKRALADLELGGRVRVTSVHGDFVWPAEGPLLLVAGGIGITPFLSQVAAEPDRDVHLVYGVRSADAVPFADRLAFLGDRLHVIAGATLTADQISAAVPDLADRTAFVSGTPAMVDALAPDLRRRVKQVRTDHFLGY